MGDILPARTKSAQNRSQPMLGQTRSTTIDPAAILAVISEQAARIAAREAENTDLRAGREETP
ncbi:hypothetical protein [Demequina salsinemoris]|uniref:hypothetical protein n=1 Tax=Demequina salsinemoris TaxID=577470 RepID=UPI001364B578|nr:hypothetical protein [Demequina salsinemoris]